MQRERERRRESELQKQSQTAERKVNGDVIWEKIHIKKIVGSCVVGKAGGKI